jgi:hypothetical protein
MDLGNAVQSRSFSDGYYAVHRYLQTSQWVAVRAQVMMSNRTDQEPIKFTVVWTKGCSYPLTRLAFMCWLHCLLDMTSVHLRTTIKDTNSAQAQANDNDGVERYCELPN